MVLYMMGWRMSDWKGKILHNAGFLLELLEISLIFLQNCLFNTRSSKPTSDRLGLFRSICLLIFVGPVGRSAGRPSIRRRLGRPIDHTVSEFVYQSKGHFEWRAIICVPTYVPDLSQYDEIYDICRKYPPNTAAITVYEIERIFLCESWHTYKRINVHGLCEFLTTAVQGDAVLNSGIRNVIYHAKSDVLIQLGHLALPSRWQLSPEV